MAGHFSKVDCAEMLLTQKIKVNARNVFNGFIRVCLKLDVKIIFGHKMLLVLNI